MRSVLVLSLMFAAACRAKEAPGDLDGDGVLDAEDCAPATKNGAEVCDGVDNDCNGAIDDAPDAATWYADADHDGFGDPTTSQVSCVAPPGSVANFDDCDDDDPQANPSATEVCGDTVDRNCDGTIGNDDGDGDGTASCLDCNDGDEDINPDADEICDGDDNDCDGIVDEDAVDADEFAIDVDGDGHGNDRFIVASCDVPNGYVLATNADDCDDLDPANFPGAPEECDGEDNDCDGAIDDGAQGKGAWYADSDEDGYGDPSGQVLSCVRPAGYVTNFDDCNDANKGINPAANESCSDTTDRNCDGAVGRDDNDGDGTVACDDCDDGRADVEPGAPELCDGLDNDCDALIDESAPTWYADFDGDKHGNDRLVVVACEAPAGYVSTFDDCDDFDAKSYPGATEGCDGVDTDCDGNLATGEADADGDGFLACADDCDDTSRTRSPLGVEQCNGADDDCDGTTDEPDAVDAQTWFGDADGDGYGDTKLTKEACSAPSGYVGNDRDCNDLTKVSYPGATEACDSADNDCDGEIDEGAASGSTTYYVDGDGDGYGGVVTSKACSAPAGFVSKAGDCDDGDAQRKPGATEACNGVDDDCDGSLGTKEADADNDGVRACSDCDDANAQIRPGAVELCNGKDDNCDTKVDETGVDAPFWYRDADNDKFGDSKQYVLACAAPSGYAAASGDCNDGDAKFYPGADPVCDTKDHDCDGHIDFDADDDGYAAGWCGGKDCNESDPAVADSSGNCNRDCKDLYMAGNKSNGVYTIDPDGSGGIAPVQVNCEMTRDGGGWTQVAKMWYTSPSVIYRNAGAVGSVGDGLTLQGNAYKLSDVTIRAIIGSSNNFDVMADQIGYNSAYSSGNYEYSVMRNYTAVWQWDAPMPESSTTPTLQVYRISDNALAWTGRLQCGQAAGGGINCGPTVLSGSNPGGGSGCTISMGTATSGGWNYFWMYNTNQDTYFYLCNGAQHSSGFTMNHRYWIRRR